MRRLELGPLPVLAAGALAALALEGARPTRTLGVSGVWPLAQALVVAAALTGAWRTQERLRLVPLLALTLVFDGAWMVVDAARGLGADFDAALLYRGEGSAFLHGRYPSEHDYPPGAVLLFAALERLGGGETRLSTGFAMLPFQLACVVCVWGLRTRWSGWLAALVALWPLDLFFLQFRFDAVPTAFLAAGLVLALRERFACSGALLGLGAALKWSPALALAVLAVWLASLGRLRAALAHVGAFAAVFLLVNLPFLAWRPSAVLETYRHQGARRLTSESAAYLPLKLLGLAGGSGGELVSVSIADVPGWANPAAVVVQIALVVALVLLARRRPLPQAVALAALAPLVFLLANRIFSPQYLVTVVTAGALAAALVARSRREQLALGALLALAATGNYLVYPALSGAWLVASAGLFLCAFAASAVIAARASSSATSGSSMTLKR